MNDKHQLVILGAGYGCSEALALIKDLNTLQHEYELIAILDDNEKLHNTLVDGVLVEGSLSQWDKYPEGVKFVFAIGNFKNRLMRYDLLDKLSIPFERFHTLIHPNATIYNNVDIGKGCIIHAGCVVHPQSKIGNHVVIYACSVVGVKNFIGDNALIAASVITATDIKIGTNSFIGTGSIIAPEVELGPGSMVAVGSVVFRDVLPGYCVIGNPAKVYNKDEVPRIIIEHWESKKLGIVD